VIKLVVGILKGAVIGGAVGYGAYALGTALQIVISPWLVYGVVGALVGLVAGRPIWSLIRDKNATSWVSILKAAFGFGVGCGLYALVDRVIHPGELLVAGQNVFTWPVTLGGAIGAVYGGFVELDDAIGDDKSEKKAAAVAPVAPAKKPPAKR
jgi:hypothetical protein